MYISKKLKDMIWHGQPFLALVVWGILCISDQLWYDEAFSAGLVMQPWGRLIRITAVDDHSPFYYVLLKLFYELCGAGFGLFGAQPPFCVLKIFSLIFMMGYLYLGKYYVARLFGKDISIYFMTLSLLSPLVGVQAGNVRMYAMALFFLTAAGLLSYDLYRKESRRKWLLFTGASICVVYCHTFAMIQTFWLYVVFLIVLLRSGQRAKLKHLLIAGGTVSVTFAPWLAVTFRQMQIRMRDDVGSVQQLAGLKEIEDYLREWFSALETPINEVLLAEMVMTILLFVAATVYARKKDGRVALIGMLPPVLTVLTGFLVSAFLNNCFMGRYVFPGYGFVMLFMAFGVRALSRTDDNNGKAFAGGLLLTGICCFSMQYSLEILMEFDGGLQQYEQFWEEQVKDGDIMIAPHGHAIFLSIYHPDHQYCLKGYVPADLSFPNLNACYDIGKLVRERGRAWYITFAGNTPDEAEDGLTYEKATQFHYMYYDFVIFQLTDSEDASDTTAVPAR